MLAETEKRTMRRFDMRLPATIRIPDMRGPEFLTETRNVSARGVFFYMDRHLECGTQIEVTMTFPPHITLTESLRVRFTAQVIRTEAAEPSGRIGVAAVIRHYEFLSAATSAAQSAEVGVHPQ
jgi:hypothetical protein